LTPVSSTPAIIAKFARGVVETGGKFATGVVDTSGAPDLLEMTLMIFSEAWGKMIHE
jgi:hypothetical protein